MLQSEVFVSEEKKKLLSKLDVETLGIETAIIVNELNFKINRVYTDVAWSVLDEENKYALLLNQIDAYKNEELPNLFSELAPVYHQLVERTRHKFKFTYNDYNKTLLDKLVQKDYITSAKEEWIVSKNSIDLIEYARGITAKQINIIPIMTFYFIGR